MHYVGDVSRDPNGVDPREFHGLGRVRNPDGVFKVLSDEDCLPNCQQCLRFCNEELDKKNNFL